MSGLTHWLLVERVENWRIDEQEGFRRFGLPDQKKRLADEIKKGDILIIYISSGLSMISDIREATVDGTTRLGRSGNYDTPYSVSISTKPLLTLPRKKWVRFNELIDKLSFTLGKKNWSQIMRNCLRRLSKEDADIIINAINQSHQNEPNKS